MKTTNLKMVLRYFPEVSLLLLSIMAMIGSINYLAIAFFAMILTLIIWKNKLFALVLSILLGFGSFWMLSAAVSEYREFPQGDPAAIKLLLVGSSISLFMLVIAIVMPVKYFTRK